MNDIKMLIPTILLTAAGIIAIFLSCGYVIFADDFTGQRMWKCDVHIKADNAEKWEY